jgi:hypothetical protein
MKTISFDFARITQVFVVAAQMMSKDNTRLFSTTAAKVLFNGAEKT